MILDIKEQFIRLFEDAQILMKFFGKKQYESSFQEQYRKYQRLLTEADEAISGEDTDKVLLELASVIPDYVKNELSGIEQKRKRESAVMNYNLAMVTYVLPVINYNRSDNLRKLSDMLTALWNQEISGSPIKNALYEDISGGFKTHPCYITTAVCESLGKEDDCCELETLRRYRDDYLLETGEGRAIVEEYYNVAPTIVKRINKMDNAKEVYRGIYQDYLVPCIRLAKEEQNMECQKIYSSMVRNLQTKYLHS